MAFDAYSASENAGKKTEIDWDALNKYTVETAGLQKQETLVGYVSGIVDLGNQEQEDAEVEFKGTAADEASEIADKPATYFKDGVNDKGKAVRLKCWPQKPVQCVAVSVDFPDIMIDKGTFFGKSSPQPLRLWLGDSFYLRGAGMVVGRPTPLRITKADGAWSFAKNHLFYKMAIGAKLIEDGEAFLPKDIDALLGKAFQFSAQVYMRKGNDGKSYYTEKIKFGAPLGRGQIAPEPVNPPLIIQFNRTNDPKDVEQLRNHVVNTIKRAKNFEGSVIQAELKSAGLVKDEAKPEAPVAAPAQVVAPAKAKPVKKAVTVAVEDEDTPF